MNWLARFKIDVKDVRAEGILDSYGWHKKLWECFPDEPESKRDFLTRIDQFERIFQIWILAKRKPVLPKWCHADDFQIKKIPSSFLSHKYYAFDLRANPSKRIVQLDDNGVRKGNGKRVALVKYDELRAWIINKGRTRCRDLKTGLDVPGGFRILEEKTLEISPMVESYFRKKGHSGWHGGVQFRGTLEITDRDRFIETYQSGIGSAKGFGFGLLLLAPVDCKTTLKEKKHETHGIAHHSICTGSLPQS